jgi:hypothetical protein
MTDNLKQAYVDKMNAQMKELGAKVEVIKAQLAKGAADVKIDYHTQIAEWQKMETNFGNQLEAAASATADSFETVKSEVQTAWHDLSHYVAEHFEKANEALFPKKNDSAQK